MRKLALIGKPGAGKSTSALLLKRSLVGTITVPLAMPLYDVQRFFYERLRAPLAEGQQDGVLLHFMGGYFRNVDANFLLSDFAERVVLASTSAPSLILCDDARPTDVDGLRELGFTLVEIRAPEDVRQRRLKERNDARRGDDQHVTERGSFTPDFIVDNNGDLALLEARMISLLEGLEDNPAQGFPQDGARILYERASQFVGPRYAPSRHQIATALVTDTGAVFEGLHTETIIGRASVCAESVAIGNCLAAARGEITMVVTVRHPRPEEADTTPRVVPPCGICRELIADWAPNAQIAVSGGASEEITLERATGLLPNKYTGTKWGSLGEGSVMQ